MATVSTAKMSGWPPSSPGWPDTAAATADDAPSASSAGHACPAVSNFFSASVGIGPISSSVADSGLIDDEVAGWSFTLLPPKDTWRYSTQRG